MWIVMRVVCTRLIWRRVAPNPIMSGRQARTTHRGRTPQALPSHSRGDLDQPHERGVCIKPTSLELGDVDAYMSAPPGSPPPQDPGSDAEIVLVQVPNHFSVLVTVPMVSCNQSGIDSIPVCGVVPTRNQDRIGTCQGW